MAIQMQAYSKSVQQKAMELVAKSDKWAEGRRNRDGVRFILFASCSRADIFYFTRIDGAFCSCPAGSKSRTGRCHHRLACQIVSEQAQEQAAKPTKRYEDIWTDDVLGLAEAF